MLSVFNGPQAAWSVEQQPAQAQQLGLLKRIYSRRTRIVVRTGGHPRWPTVPRHPLGHESLLASSFCECMNSCANQINPFQNNLLGDGKMEKLVTCCMNRNLIVFMHKYYPQAVRKPTSQNLWPRINSVIHLLIKPIFAFQVPQNHETIPTSMFGHVTVVVISRIWKTFCQTSSRLGTG